MWTSGDLTTLYPDHVAAKSSAAADISRLKELYKTIGGWPLLWGLLAREGMRDGSEATALTWECLDLERRTLRLEKNTEVPRTWKVDPSVTHTRRSTRSPPRTRSSWWTNRRRLGRRSMIGRYRRVARTAEELDVGDFSPLDVLLFGKEETEHDGTADADESPAADHVPQPIVGLQSGLQDEAVRNTTPRLRGRSALFSEREGSGATGT